jgi:hypothetical protein
VAVEKLPLSRNSEKLRGRKCLGKLRTSFIELPNAKFFRPFSDEGVFQQPRLLTSTMMECMRELVLGLLEQKAAEAVA